MADEDAHDALRETPLKILKTPENATEMNLVTIPSTIRPGSRVLMTHPGDPLRISTTPSP